MSVPPISRQYSDAPSAAVVGAGAKLEAPALLDVCVFGLGYIGLPTAALLASRGLRVHGVDIDPSAVNRVREALPFHEPELGACLQAAVDGGNLTASDAPLPAVVYVIAVPTPLAATREPDISAVVAVVQVLAGMLQGGELVCIESTCPIGTAEAIARRLPDGVDVACCPERVLPGRILEELVRNDRVVGGVGADATARGVAFYRTFAEGEVIGTDARTAEAVKLAENAFRDVNIAFANELSMFAAEVGVDVHAVIRLANRHPRVEILQPGPGVGGHCVAVDPWFLVSAAPATTRLIRTAREVNLAKTDWVVERVRERLRPSSVVACLGLTYKADVDDLRESPARAVADALAVVARVLRVDPYVPDSCALAQALAEADIVVGLVAHREFRSLRTEQLQGKVILDFAGVFA